MTYYLIYLSISFFLTYSTVYPIKKLAKDYKIVSEKSPLRNREIPYLGGVAVYLGFILTLILFFYIEFPDQEIKISLGNPKFLGILLGAIFVTFAGLIHDVYPYSVLVRIVIHLLSACVLIVNSISIESLQIIPMSLGNGDFYLGNIFFSICWVIIVINSIDFLEQIDGLLTNLLVAISAILFLFSVVNDQYENALILSVVMGGLLGIFIDQVKPSKILLGKAGTYFLGFVIAATAMDLQYSSNSVANLIIPLCILFIPITYIIASLFVPGKNVIVLLMNNGINDEKQTLYSLLITCILSAISFVVAHNIG